MITAAIVGLGRWGRTLVGAVQGKSERLRFTHAVVRREAPHREFAAAHGLGLSDDYDAVLADGGIDAIVIATPHSLHCRQVTAAAQAGKHVFCEKPLSLAATEAASAVAACECAGVVLRIDTDEPLHGAVCDQVRLVNTGQLGDPMQVLAHLNNG